MRVSELLLDAAKFLSPAEARILLAHAASLSREFFLAHPEYEVPTDCAQNFFALRSRRERGVPLAYLTHHKEFFGLDFYVDERVLIPRPETELLVEEVLERQFILGETKVSPTSSPSFARTRPPSFCTLGPAKPDPRLSGGEVVLRKPKVFKPGDEATEEGVRKPRPSGRAKFTLPHGAIIIDVGTGSGCIAISLAKHIPKAKILALDISEPALAVARRNAESHGVSDRIELVKSDLLETVMVSLSNHDRPYAVVANLPYIGTHENNLVSREVSDHEPHAALFSGPSGLLLYEKLFQQTARLARFPVFLAAEIGFSQKKAVAKLIKKYFGNVSVVWKNDLAGLNRIFTICMTN